MLVLSVRHLMYACFVSNAMLLFNTSMFLSIYCLTIIPVSMSTMRALFEITIGKLIRVRVYLLNAIHFVVDVLGFFFSATVLFANILLLLLIEKRCDFFVLYAMLTLSFI